MSSENDITEDNNSDSDATIENNQLEDHVEEKPFICVECGDCFSYKASLASHMLTHTEVDTPEQKPVVCPVCGECFTEKRDFDIHSKQHTDGEYEEFQYKECGQIVVENSANHKNENGVDKLFENKEWNNFLKESINVNIVKTLPDKEIDDTKQPTKVVAKRKRAKRTPTATNDISDDTEKQFECPQCGKFYKSNKSLKDHIRTHRTDRPFICEECGKDFTSNYNLKSHLRTHNPRRDFSCEVCGKSFAYSNSLVNHQRKHTGERPYKCTECDRRFICSSNLVSHMRVHTGDRPFKCDECGRGFSYKGELERHKRIHTGEKPYQCDICKNRYNCVGELTRHKRAHTGERPYKCDDCGKRFLRNSHLTSHIKTHTDISMLPLNTEIGALSSQDQTHNLSLMRSGKKLSKRENDMHVEYFKNKGYFPEALQTFMCFMGSGFDVEQSRIPTLDPPGLVEHFDLSKMNTNSTKLDFERLTEFSRLHIYKYLKGPKRRQTIDDVKLIVRDYFKNRSCELEESSLDDDFITRVLEWSEGTERITVLQDLTNEEFLFLWRKLTSSDSLVNSLNKMCKVNSPQEYLTVALQQTECLSTDSISELDQLRDHYKTAIVTHQLKIGEFMKVVRYVLYGNVSGPSVAELVNVLGKQRTIDRLSQVIQILHTEKHRKNL